MRLKPKPGNILWLLLGITGVSALGWYINSFGPEPVISVALFFGIFFLSSFFLLLFIFNNMRRAILITSGLSIFLLLRLLNLREHIYWILLIFSLISFNFLFTKK